MTKSVSNSEFYILHDFENTSIGKKLSAWPLHCTITPFFITDSISETDIIGVSKAVVEAFDPIEINSGKKALYGPNENIPVLEVKDNQNQLHKLHNSLIFYLGFSSCRILDYSYALDNYSPHVTLKNNQSLPDFPYLIKTLSLGKKTSRASINKSIIATFNIGI